MAAFSTTSCASSQRKPLAVIQNGLIGASMMLVLAACSGDAQEQEGEQPAPLPPLMPPLADQGTNASQPSLATIGQTGKEPSQIDER